MIKIACFVEGLTETIFLRKLILERFDGDRCGIIEIRLQNWDSEGLFLEESVKPGDSRTDCEFRIIEVPSYDKLTSFFLENAASQV